MSETNKPEANKALVRRWFEEVWNQGREETIDELFAANGVGYGLGDTDVTTSRSCRVQDFRRICAARCRIFT